MRGCARDAQIRRQVAARALHSLHWSTEAPPGERLCRQAGRGGNDRWDERKGRSDEGVWGDFIGWPLVVFASGQANKLAALCALAADCKHLQTTRTEPVKMALCVCVCLVARQESIDFMASLDRLLSCKLSCSVASSSNENRVDGGGGSSVAGGFLALAGQRVRPERRGGRR